MRLAPHELGLLASEAIAAAREAGELVARTRPRAIEHKPGAHSPASQVVTEVDRKSQEIILRALSPTLDRFELGLLTEERDDDGGRLGRHASWCIDPIDGTLPFIEGTAGYAVSIALVAHDGVPWIGVVYDPVQRRLYHAIRGEGAFLDEHPWQPLRGAQGRALSFFIDRGFERVPGKERIVAMLDQIARDLGLEGMALHTGGGAVMNACQVLLHPPACSFKRPKPQAGGGSLWDYAATACLFEEVGGIATDILGQPLELNRAESTFMNHRGVLFATDPELAGRIRELHRAMDERSAVPGGARGP